MWLGNSGSTHQLTPPLSKRFMQSQAVDSLRIPRCWHRCSRRALINDTEITPYSKADRRSIQLAYRNSRTALGYLWTSPQLGVWPRSKKRGSGERRAVRGFLAKLVMDRLTASPLPRFLRLSPQTAKTFGQFRVHVLYKRPEIPANKVVPAIAVSVTYSKQ